MLRIGVDVGGTFTDVVAVDDDGGVHFAKTPSTPQDQSIGVVTGVQQILENIDRVPSHVAQLVHGTTVATNTLLERSGAVTALITTRGFRDLLHIGRQDRPRLYDLRVQRPAPLIPRRLRREIDERVLFTGELELPLDVKQLKGIVCECLEQGVQSIAVCFLHSYANSINERQAAAEIKRLAPDLHVSVSSQILSEFREYERLSTTVINAYVQRSTKRYLDQLSSRLATGGVSGALMVMQSNGGMMSAEAASERAIHTLLSGPAGGVLAASHLSNLFSGRSFITADVGGTSFDVALVENGMPILRTEGRVEGYTIKFPHIDIHTIGAGGGSIAWVDAGGGLRVGPKSAGAVPGPICYSRGGVEPTVCDAFAALGWLGEHSLLGGEMTLDVQAARAGIEEYIARPLKLTVNAAAEGILRIATAAMCRAIRLITVERGQDPRRFTLLSYGGAGPLHGSDIARELGIQKILVPIAPGNFSALGLLTAPVKHDEVATFRATEANLDIKALSNTLAMLEARVKDHLKRDGCTEDNIVWERKADLRYVGQAYELSVPFALSAITAEVWTEAKTAFHRQHERLYGFSREQAPVELINVRVTGMVPSPKLDLRLHRNAIAVVGAIPSDKREVFFQNSWMTTPIFRRESLVPGSVLTGPAVIEELGSTFVLFPGDTLVVDRLGCLEVVVSQEKATSAQKGACQ